MKSVARGTFPTLWRGTKSVAIPKAGTPAWSLKGWRHMALLKAGAKGVGKAIRQRFGRWLGQLCWPWTTRGVALSVHRGSGADGSSICSSCTRETGLRSGHFLDGKAAYCSVIREFLLPTGDADEPDRLRNFLAKLHHNEEQQDVLLATLAGPGILAKAGVPASLTDFVRSTLQQLVFHLSI